MRKSINPWGVSVFVALALAAVQNLALAQDPVKVAPNNYKVVFENDTVRVCDVHGKTGEKIAMHSHPDHMVYTAGGGKIRFTYPDGKSKDVELKPGDAVFIKAETHATEIVGPGEFKAVVIELKQPAGVAMAKLPDAEDQAKVSPESTKALVDNERVRLLDVHLKAGGKLAKHSHPATLAYAVTEAKVKITSYPDEKATDKQLAAGQVMWSDPVIHSVENIGTAEGHILVVELKEAPKVAEKKPTP